MRNSNTKQAISTELIIVSSSVFKKSFLFEIARKEFMLIQLKIIDDVLYFIICSSFDCACLFRTNSKIGATIVDVK